MEITEPFIGYLAMAAKTCLWCRGTGFKDQNGCNTCDQCFNTAILLEVQEDRLLGDYDDV